MVQSRTALDAIGNTPLVELRRVEPAGAARIVAVVAAVRVAARLGPPSTVATIVVDSGLRYLSRDVFEA